MESSSTITQGNKPQKSPPPPTKTIELARVRRGAFTTSADQIPIPTKMTQNVSVIHPSPPTIKADHNNPLKEEEKNLQAEQLSIPKELKKKEELEGEFREIVIAQVIDQLFKIHPESLSEEAVLKEIKKLYPKQFASQNDEFAEETKRLVKKKILLHQPLSKEPPLTEKPRRGSLPDLTNFVGNSSFLKTALKKGNQLRSSIRMGKPEDEEKRGSLEEVLDQLPTVLLIPPTSKKKLEYLLLHLLECEIKENYFSLVQTIRGKNDNEVTMELAARIETILKREGLKLFSFPIRCSHAEHVLQKSAFYPFFENLRKAQTLSKLIDIYETGDGVQKTLAEHLFGGEEVLKLMKDICKPSILAEWVGHFRELMEIQESVHWLEKVEHYFDASYDRKRGFPIILEDMEQLVFTFRAFTDNTLVGKKEYFSFNGTTPPLPDLQKEWALETKAPPTTSNETLFLSWWVYQIGKLIDPHLTPQRALEIVRQLLDRFPLNLSALLVNFLNKTIEGFFKLHGKTSIAIEKKTELFQKHLLQAVEEGENVQQLKPLSTFLVEELKLAKPFILNTINLESDSVDVLVTKISAQFKHHYFSAQKQPLIRFLKTAYENYSKFQPDALASSQDRIEEFKAYLRKNLDIERKDPAFQSIYLDLFIDELSNTYSLLFNCFHPNNKHSPEMKANETIMYLERYYHFLKNRERIPFLELLLPFMNGAAGQAENFLRLKYTRLFPREKKKALNFFKSGNTKFAFLYNSVTKSFSVTHKQVYQLEKLNEEGQKESLGLAKVEFSNLGKMGSSQYSAKILVGPFFFYVSTERKTRLATAKKLEEIRNKSLENLEKY